MSDVVRGSFEEKSRRDCSKEGIYTSWFPTCDGGFLVAVLERLRGLVRAQPTDISKSVKNLIAGKRICKRTRSTVFQSGFNLV